MAKRKTIACLLIRPESIYQKRVMDGLQAQCECYDYNLAVFSPLVDISHFYNDYLEAELNIFNLINPDKFDAVIIASLPLIPKDDDSILQRIVKRLRDKCSVPIISLDYELEGCHTIYTDERTDFYHLTKHLTDCHGCRKIYALTGIKGIPVTETRVQGYKDALLEVGVEVSENDIFYGDFWYTSGEELAERIASGEVELPEAIVCAGDHMAIGLTNRLIKHGIKVPQQVIVAGFDGTVESIMNSPSVTSYTPSVNLMAAEAVNRVRSLIEPELPVIEPNVQNNSGLLIGETCGCRIDLANQKRMMQASMYRVNRNFGDDAVHNIDNFSTLVENFMLENLTKSETPIECLKQIYSFTYLIEPFEHFYLCLRPDWLAAYEGSTVGYPETMRRVIHTILYGTERFDEHKIVCRDEERDNFPTAEMLPELWEENEQPSVFFFAPCHFSTNPLGYAVYQCDISRRTQVTIVFQNWLRNVNNALEMARAKNELISASVTDSMTKLTNRRGMELTINDRLSVREKGDMLLAIVIDMDGLKHINDTYGHNEGDTAIMTIASVVRFITRKSETAARAGGDEFYILGVGKYDEQAVLDRIDEFYKMLQTQSGMLMKPYEITASVGYSLTPADDVTDVYRYIATADLMMYNNKAERKKNKKQS